MKSLRFIFVICLAASLGGEAACKDRPVHVGSEGVPNGEEPRAGSPTPRAPTVLAKAQESSGATSSPKVPITENEKDGAAVKEVVESKDRHAIVATRKDGTRFMVIKDRVKRFQIADKSSDMSWVLLWWSESDIVRPGRFEQTMALLSVKHRRLLAPEDLQIKDNGGFLIFDTEGGKEMLVYRTGREEGRIEVDKLDSLIKDRSDK